MVYLPKKKCPSSWLLVPNKDKKCTDEKRTIEFHCDHALFLVVHDCIGVVVCLPNNYLNILLGSSSWRKQNREQSASKDAALFWAQEEKLTFQCQSSWGWS